MQASASNAPALVGTVAGWVADGWTWAKGTPLTIVCTVVGAIILRFLLHRLIGQVVQAASDRAELHLQGHPPRARRVLAEATGLHVERARQRAATTGALLRSITSVVVFGIAMLTVISELGVPLGPLLASAGVGGVALGFGAQSLVKDFLSGIFMIVEDQYGVGDIVDTGQAIGTVEDVTLRVTRLRDGNGVVWYIRNGEIVRIGNKSQGWSTAFIDIPVAYSESLGKVLPLIRDAVHSLDSEEEWASRLIEEPQVAGVESMAGGAITIRVIAKCIPNDQFTVSREIRERVKAAFDREGVQGPAVPPFAAGGVGV